MRRGSNVISNKYFKLSVTYNGGRGTTCKIKGQDKLYMAINHQSSKDKEMEWCNKSPIAVGDSEESWMRLDCSGVIKPKSFLSWQCQSLEMLLWNTAWMTASSGTDRTTRNCMWNDNTEPMSQIRLLLSTREEGETGSELSPKAVHTVWIIKYLFYTSSQREVYTDRSWFTWMPLWWSW